MAPTWIETDTNTNKDINAAVAVGVYTSTGDKFIMPQLLADQVAGGGDYVYYVTLQVAGAGSHYVIGPKTTHTAAAGELAIGAQGGFIAVRAGDVVTVYIDGLAGDTTTPDVTVRWFELDAAANVTYWAGQATSHTDGTPDTNLKWINGVQLASTSSEGYLPAEIDAFSEGAIRTAIGLATANMDTQLAAVAKTGADGDTLETLSDQIDGTATASALATVDGIVDALALVAPDNKPTVAATGEATTNVTYWAGVAVAAADASGYINVLNVIGNVDGTVGEIMNFSATAQQASRDAMKLAPTAGAPAAGSVDAHLDALALEATAQAVLAAIGGQVVEGAYTRDEILRIVAAALAGATSGSGTDTVEILGLDGVTTRITATLDGSGNRTGMTLDGEVYA